ncbi:MAG: crossover junction endodeoxyribonuclease RuvC [Chloroflexi bacterium]|nr:crossover junction endodeoxyribonuclease RuvC [Chloroflexota bacterium]
MGFGVVEEAGSTLRAIQFGVLTTTNADSLPKRLQILHAGLTDLIATHQPSAVAVESLFFNRNVRTALAVGHARGVALLAAAQADVPVYEYTPQQVKDAVVGYGKATKEQVQIMIMSLLGLASVPRPDDAADALAISICQLHSARMTRLTTQPGARR